MAWPYNWYSSQINKLINYAFFIPKAFFGRVICAGFLYSRNRLTLGLNWSSGYLSLVFDIVWLLFSFRYVSLGPHLEHELFPFQGTWVHPRFLVGFVFLDLYFSIVFCLSFFVSFFFLFGHCVVCPSSIYDFLLSLCYFHVFFQYALMEYSLFLACIFRSMWFLLI